MLAEVAASHAPLTGGSPIGAMDLDELRAVALRRDRSAAFGIPRRAPTRRQARQLDEAPETRGTRPGACRGARPTLQAPIGAARPQPRRRGLAAADGVRRDQPISRREVRQAEGCRRNRLEADWEEAPLKHHPAFPDEGTSQRTSEHGTDYRQQVERSDRAGARAAGHCALVAAVRLLRIKRLPRRAPDLCGSRADHAAFTGPVFDWPLTTSAPP